jgi:hypothetical protein
MTSTGTFGSKRSDTSTTEQVSMKKTSMIVMFPGWDHCKSDDGEALLEYQEWRHKKRSNTIDSFHHQLTSTRMKIAQHNGVSSVIFEDESSSSLNSCMVPSTIYCSSKPFCGRLRNASFTRSYRDDSNIPVVNQITHDLAMI